MKTIDKLLLKARIRKHVKQFYPEWVSHLSDECIKHIIEAKGKYFKNAEDLNVFGLEQYQMFPGIGIKRANEIITIRSKYR